MLPAPLGSVAPQSRPDLVFLPAGKAEEKTGGRFQLPWRDVSSETPGRPAPPGSARGGRGAVNSWEGSSLPTQARGSTQSLAPAWAGPHHVPHVGYGRVGWAQGSSPWPMGRPQRMPGGASPVGACRSRPSLSGPSGVHLRGELGVTSWLQMIPELIQSTCITRALASHSGGAGLPDRPSVAILHPVSPVFES